VTPGAIPVPAHWFRIKRDYDVEIFGYSVQQIARNPQLIRTADTFDRSHLEFPLNK
jgi:hypothetical protein